MIVGEGCGFFCARLVPKWQTTVGWVNRVMLILLFFLSFVSLKSMLWNSRKMIRGTPFDYFHLVMVEFHGFFRFGRTSFSMPRWWVGGCVSWFLHFKHASFGMSRWWARGEVSWLAHIGNTMASDSASRVSWPIHLGHVAPCFSHRASTVVGLVPSQWLPI